MTQPHLDQNARSEANALTLRSILVPTDFSASAQVALDVATELAQKYGAKLALLHVQRTTHAGRPGAGGGVTVPNVPAPGSEIHESVLAQLDSLVDKCDEFDVATTAHVVSTERGPEEAIVDLATRHVNDLIVMGTHGRSALRRFVLGSVAMGVLRHASVPVLVIPGSGQTRQG